MLPPPTDAVSEFKLSIPAGALDGLKARLAMTRRPNKETVGDWSQGMPLEKIKGLADYWRTTYDTRRREQRLNAVPQFRTQIDGLGIHFLHVKSKHSNALPIIMTHGWPGSVVELLKVLGPLTDPTAHGGKAEDAFHEVVPSLPGYGFSDKPTARGWGNVVTDASGGVSPEAHDMAIRRLVAAGAQPLTWLGMAGELQRDWARTERLGEVARLFRDHAGTAGSVLAWEMQLLRASEVEGG